MADQHVRDFEQAALVHVDELLRAARRLSGGDAPAAEDLLQETLLRAWRSFHRFTPGTNCRAWLHKILLHVRAQQTRRERRRHALEQSTAAPPEARSSTAAITTADHIRRAFAELPPHYQAVILLAHVEDLSYREIAAALDVPVGTVMSRLNRGRRQLRARFRELETRHARVRRIIAAAVVGAFVLMAPLSTPPNALPRSIADALLQHEICALQRVAAVTDPVDAARVSGAMPRVDLRVAGLHPVSGHVCSGPGGRYVHVVFADARHVAASVLFETDPHAADEAQGTFTSGRFAVAVARARDRGGYIVTNANAATSAAAGLTSLTAFFREMHR